MTTITTEQANKIQEVALFSTAIRSRSLTNLLTQEAPKTAQGDKGKQERQTAPTAPIIRVTDLGKGGGDTVEMDLVHKLTKSPTMGDKKIAGRGEGIDFTKFELSINQGRHQVDAGGKMTQQRTTHELKKTARTLLGTYFNDFQDQLATFHLAGARGDYFASDTIVPLSDHEEFAEIMVNPLTAPTYDRHFFGGDATSIETLDSADVFTMESVDNMDLFLEEMANPLQPIKFMGKDAQMAGGEPFYLLMVTPRQWNSWKQTASHADWQQLTANALSRASDFDHPVFRGDCVMRGNILVRKYKGTPVRFNQGSVVNVAQNNNDATETTQQTATTVDRAILLGGQALANAYGKTSGGNSFSIHQENTDAGNRQEITIGWMNGLKKIRFRDKFGRLNDHGTMVMDTAVKAG